MFNEIARVCDDFLNAKMNETEFLEKLVKMVDENDLEVELATAVRDAFEHQS